MFERLLYPWRLSRLQRGKRARDRHHLALISAEKDHDRRDKLDWDASQDAQEYDDEIEHLQHHRLIDLAQRRQVPPPEFDGKEGAWVQSRFTGRWRLSRIELAKLRKEIRADSKERFEAWSRWIPVVSAITGLLGLVVAIMAMLRR